jgi:predicted nucleic acid-binding protein
LIGRYGLLEELYRETLIVTELVVTEIRNGVASLPKLSAGLEAISRGQLEVLNEVTEEELATAGGLPRKFSAADRVGLAVALHRKWTLMTDERALLRECASRGIVTMRTEEILKEAVDKGLIMQEDLSKMADDMEREASFRPNV